MTDHLEKYELIVEQQHWFVTNKSCLTNLLETIDAIIEVRNWFSAAVVFMDFTKAFDRVCHRALIRKLEAYKFNGSLLAWLKDFLFWRKQRKFIGENASDWKDILIGLPQGSVLGTLLFLIYINYLISQTTPR